MTLPTQSQIDAVKRELNRLVILSGDSPYDWDYVAQHVIAAAQVGEFDNRYEPRHYRTLNEEAKYWDQPEKEAQVGEPMTTLTMTRDTFADQIKRNKAATIERCKQVVYDIIGPSDPRTPQGYDVLAALDKLKDE